MTKKSYLNYLDRTTFSNKIIPHIFLEEEIIHNTKTNKIYYHSRFTDRSKGKLININLE